MNPPIPRAMQQPWYRVDVFRGCKTGEVVEGTPRTLVEKLRIVALGVVLGVPLIVASQWLFKVWTPRYYAELDALAKTDPVASARKLAEFTSLLLLAPVLFGVVCSFVVVIRAMRLARAGRRPLPGDKGRVRTEVVAGWWCVRFPAILWGALALACLFTVWMSYVWLVAFFWNGYLDKVVAPARVGRGHAGAEARSGERFDIMMQTHHDAIGLDRTFSRCPMRTTIDIPEREHALFSALAHDHGTSLSKLVVELALRGLRNPSAGAEPRATYEVDPLTGLGIFRSGHPVTVEEVKAFLADDDLPA